MAAGGLDRAALVAMAGPAAGRAMKLWLTVGNLGLALALGWYEGFYCKLLAFGVIVQLAYLKISLVWNLRILKDAAGEHLKGFR